jgi:hypothetical protein
MKEEEIGGMLPDTTGGSQNSEKQILKRSTDQQIHRIE